MKFWYASIFEVESLSLKSETRSLWRIGVPANQSTHHLPDMWFVANQEDVLHHD